MKKREAYSNSRELIDVLKAMHTYLTQEDKNFHIQFSMIYCRSCQAIQFAGGDYQRHIGNDCNGAHHQIIESPMECRGCKTKEFIKIAPTDIFGLRKEDPILLIEGIAKGLKNLDYPSLYNENLPKYVKAWKNLPKQEKIRQISNLMKFGKRIQRKKQELESLEACLE